jgi:hypothetical protein
MCTILFEVPNKFVTNNIWFKGTSDWDAASLLELAEAVWDSLAITFPATTHVQAIMRKIEARAMHTQFGANVAHEPATSIPGAVTTSTILPNQVAVVTTFLTGFVGRSFRGRAYNVGLGEANITNNTVVGTFRTSRNTQWTALIDITGSNSPVFSVCSRFQGGLPREAGILTPIIGVVTNDRVDTQRRRLPKL